ncbi:hypothetical protein KAH27_02365 [bacterium]|nr:hypothetical protein [bacterium]
MTRFITLIFSILFVAAIIPDNCFAAMISVQSSTDSNGVYFYSVTSGDEPLTFGGNEILGLRIPSQAVQDIFSPEGWTSELSDNVVIWNCTNSDAYITDQPIVFSLTSSITEGTNYSMSSDNYPAGKVLGSVYNTNGTLYTPGIDTNDFIMSMNIAGYESFNFIGPIIPEPTLLFLLVAVPCLIIRRHS